MQFLQTIDWIPRLIGYLIDFSLLRQLINNWMCSKGMLWFLDLIFWKYFLSQILVLSLTLSNYLTINNYIENIIKKKWKRIKSTRWRMVSKNGSSRRNAWESGLLQSFLWCSLARHLACKCDLWSSYRCSSSNNCWKCWENCIRS